MSILIIVSFNLNSFSSVFSFFFVRSTISLLSLFLSPFSILYFVFNSASRCLASLVALSGVYNKYFDAILKGNSLDPVFEENSFCIVVLITSDFVTSVSFSLLTCVLFASSCLIVLST